MSPFHRDTYAATVATRIIKHLENYAGDSITFKLQKSCWVWGHPHIFHDWPTPIELALSKPHQKAEEDALADAIYRCLRMSLPNHIQIERGTKYKQTITITHLRMGFYLTPEQLNIQSQMSFLNELNTLHAAAIATAQQTEEQERQEHLAKAEEDRLRGMAYALTILEDVKTEMRKSAQGGWQSANLCYNRYHQYHSDDHRDAIFATWPSNVNSDAFARGIAAQLGRQLGAGFSISLSVDEKCRPSSDDDEIKIRWS